MQAFYTLRNGEQLSTFLWSDLINEELFRDKIEVQKLENNGWSKPLKRKILKDDMGVFFYWNKEKIYVNDYDYMSVEEAIKYIENQKTYRGPYFKDMLFATMMKDTSNIGIIFELPVFETIIPHMGIAFTGDKRVKVLCVPTERRYKKNEWGYKISLEAENKKYQNFIASENLYFSDFASMVLSGKAQIVVKDEFLKEQERLSKIKPTLKEKILKFFKKIEENETIYC